MVYCVEPNNRWSLEAVVQVVLSSQLAQNLYNARRYTSRQQSVETSEKLACGEL